MTRGEQMKTLVLGLGNPILGDDGVGLRVAAEVKHTVTRPDVDVVEIELGGLNLLEVLIGYDRAIIIDAIQTRAGKPGQVHRLDERSLAASHHANSTHGIDFKGVIDLGRKLGMDLPHEFVIFAIEVRDVFSFAGNITEAARGSVSLCADMVIDELSRLPAASAFG
jgi:hydrogenase maturation protease